MPYHLTNFSSTGCLAACFGLFLGPNSLSALAANDDTQSKAEIILGIKDLTPELVTYVAKYGEPREIHVPAGNDLFKVISDSCGSANARRLYVNFFIAANAGNEDIRSLAGNADSTGARPASFVSTKDATFTLPACLFVQESVGQVLATVSGPEWTSRTQVDHFTINQALVAGRHGYVGGLQSQLAQVSAPTDGAVTTSGRDRTGTINLKPLTTVSNMRLEGAGVSSSFNDLVSLSLATADKIDAGQLIPAEQRLTNVVTAVGNSARNKNAAKGLEIALRTQEALATTENFRAIPSGTTVPATEVAQTLTHFSVKPGLDPQQIKLGLPGAATTHATVVKDVRQLRLADTGCTGPTADRAWPYSLDELRKVLRLRNKAGSSPPNKVQQLLVLDSGFPKEKIDAAPFEKRLFRKSTDEVDAQGQADFVWAASPRTSKTFEPLPAGDANYHGIGVTSMALGGVAALREHFLSSSGILDNNGFIVPMMGYAAGAQGAEVTPDLEALAATLSGASWRGVSFDVINMSMSFNSDPTPSSKPIIESFRNYTIFVFAAGEPANFAKGEPIGPTTYPASWGGKGNSNVITVGSIDGNGKYSNFSNYGDYVDIAAPGCRVPVEWWNPQTGGFEPNVKDGTSLSAPLVAFAANLLRGDYGPDAVKARLIGAGRFDESLVGKVWSARALDIPTALAVPFDVVHYSDGSTAYGNITWDTAGQNIQGQERFRDGVREIGDFSASNAEKGVSGTIRFIASDTHQQYQYNISSEIANLYDGELSNLTFKPIKEQADGNGLSLGEAELLDFRCLANRDPKAKCVQSVVLCRKEKCWVP